MSTSNEDAPTVEPSTTTVEPSTTTIEPSTPPGTNQPSRYNFPMPVHIHELPPIPDKFLSKLKEQDDGLQVDLNICYEVSFGVGCGCGNLNFAYHVDKCLIDEDTGKHKCPTSGSAYIGGKEFCGRFNCWGERKLRKEREAEEKKLSMQAEAEAEKLRLPIEAEAEKELPVPAEAEMSEKK